MSVHARKIAAGDVAIDLHPFIRKYNDGRVERILRSSFVPASEDPAASRGGVATRDVVIDERNGVSARLFLPPSRDNTDIADGDHRIRLPVILYIHGGSFCTESAFCRTYHRYAASLASRAGALVVSVEYRLAPEHPVPAAHDDAWAALRWVASLSDPWLANYADPSRTFIAGDSAGGHIAYRTAVRAASREGGDIGIEGLIIIHPYFWGARMLPSEAAWDGESVIKPHQVGELWPFVTSGKAGNDDPWIDPPVEEVASLTCRRALVAVAEKDFLRDRGRLLAARMRGCAWAGGGDGRNVTLVESEGEDHGFHLYSPLRATSRRLMESIVQFINQPSHSPAPLRWPATILSQLHDTTDSPQILLPMPTREYKAVFIDRLEKRTKTGASSANSTAVNASLTIGRGKLATKKSYGLFFGRTRAHIYGGLASAGSQQCPRPFCGAPSSDTPIVSFNTSGCYSSRPVRAAATGRRRLPIVVYFHGGSFCTESTFCRTYHRYATSLASRTGALVVSVEYRLAPEHPIPAAYDDAWAALQCRRLGVPPVQYKVDTLWPFVTLSEGEDHGFHLYSPLRATSRRLMESVVRFINERSAAAAVAATSPWPAGVLPELHECSPSRARKGKMSKAQPLLSVPSRPYQGVFLNGPDLQAPRGPSAMKINNALTVGLDKASKRGFGSFATWANPNNRRAIKRPLSASVSRNIVAKNFF
uniref:Alpha/beta hydrolase fold-3 domain-containing protein n=1 Tax=Oryza nivara TaxID=4536 RepID=A0A0E0ILU4_ORYNI